MRHGQEPCRFDGPLAADTDPIVPRLQPLQREVDRRHLLVGGFPDGLQRLIVLPLDGLIGEIGHERLVATLQILLDPTAPTFQIGATRQQLPLDSSEVPDDLRVHCRVTGCGDSRLDNGRTPTACL